MVKQGIMKSDIKVQLVNRYLYLIFKDVTATLEEDWVSFSITIGKRGESVNPFSIFNVTEDLDSKMNADGDQSANESDDPWMTLYLLFIYRHARATNQLYQTALFDRLKSQISAVSINPPALTAPKGIYKAWLNNKCFVKIVAGIDMFFCKFPMEEKSYVRFGTITSRFRDCASLLSLEHFRETTGLDGDDIFPWMATPVLEEEVHRIMRDGQELDKPDSYVPYLMDLGLSLKSPYSATACPAIYTWAHMACALLTSMRSRNARMISDANIANLKINSLIIGYVFTKNTDCEILFTKNTDLIDKLKSNSFSGVDDDENDNESQLGSDDDFGMPKGKNPDEWWFYIKAMKNQVPDKIIQFGKSEAAKMGNCRVGSIGKYLNEALA
ncbi:nucleoprotein [Porton virus]|uniref:nucleoprotein n=1 Tax=Porton virus TaxID=1272940 RepID=UPI002481D8AA|nr:nucleoprotein [Porton virus]UAX43308.1 nucleoprotein [Porton virus]